MVRALTHFPTSGKLRFYQMTEAFADYLRLKSV